MRLFAAIPSLFFALILPSYAEEPTPGLHHMSVTQTAPPPVASPAITAQAQPPEPEKTVAQPKILKSSEALKKLDDLTPWPYLTDLMIINNDQAIDTALHAIERDSGSVPPSGLFYAAKILVDRKQIEQAAFYYYAAQLRATFDMARFPAYAASQTKPKRVETRTPDQAGAIPAKPQIAMTNPHESISMLALSIGQPISRWAMADPARLKNIMNKVKAWDLATPYSYLPDYMADYDRSQARSFKDWPAILEKTRNNYFIRVNQIADGLSTLRPEAPTPSFSRP